VLAKHGYSHPRLLLAVAFDAARRGWPASLPPPSLASLAWAAARLGADDADFWRAICAALRGERRGGAHGMREPQLAMAFWALGRRYGAHGPKSGDEDGEDGKWEKV
jgi:hypothetical protein